MTTEGQPVKRRMTRQRRVILETLRGTKQHPTADWIYQEVRQEIPDISLGTVYRNLRLLKELGEIRELNWGSTYSRFDGCPAEHYHFNCQQCGRVMDVQLPVQAQLEQQLETGQDLEIWAHRLEFFGLCPECRRKKGEETGNRQYQV